MPEQWSKLLTKSAITREDYAKDPQAVLEVLEFYTDHQKRQLEQGDISSVSRSGSTGTVSSGTSSALSPYSAESTGPPARFNAGTGLAGSGIGKISSPLSDTRPPIVRQDSAPPNLSQDHQNGYSNSALAAVRAAELVNGSHVQHSGPRPIVNNGLSQGSRPAPRPLLTAQRPAPAPPAASQSGLIKPPLPDHTPSSSDLKLRAKAQGPPADQAKQPASDKVLPQRKESLAAKPKTEEQRERRTRSAGFATPTTTNAAFEIISGDHPTSNATRSWPCWCYCWASAREAPATSEEVSSKRCAESYYSNSGEGAGVALLLPPPLWRSPRRRRRESVP